MPQPDPSHDNANQPSSQTDTDHAQPADAHAASSASAPAPNAAAPAIANPASEAAQPPEPPIRVLAACHNPRHRKQIAEAIAQLAPQHLQILTASSLHPTEEGPSPAADAAPRPDLIILCDQELDRQHDHQADWFGDGAPVVVAAAQSLDADAIMRWMQLGVCDVMLAPWQGPDAARQVGRALARVRRRRQQVSRRQRLEVAYRRASAARRDAQRKLRALSREVVAGYRQIALRVEAMDQVGVGQFAEILDHTKGLESLLDQTLDLLWREVGPANIALLLPVRKEDFTVAALANSTAHKLAQASPLPSAGLQDHEQHLLILQDRAAADAPMPMGLLARLADTLPPLLTNRTATRQWTQASDMEADLGLVLADSLDGQHLAATPCWHDGELLAAITLFRDAASPFTPAQLDRCQTLAPLLAKALANATLNPAAA